MADYLKDPMISDSGEKVDNVVLDIDYQIIEHFSRHLYGSASKAVEELVTNGFDAYAQDVYVYLPGRFVEDYVAVWDDGYGCRRAQGFVGNCCKSQGKAGKDCKWSPRYS